MYVRGGLRPALQPGSSHFPNRLLLRYQQPLSLFMLKNLFFLACRGLEALETCCVLHPTATLPPSKYGSAAGPPAAAPLGHGLSDVDVGPHGYVNALAVTAQG